MARSAGPPAATETEKAGPPEGRRGTVPSRSLHFLPLLAGLLRPRALRSNLSLEYEEDSGASPSSSDRGRNHRANVLPDQPGRAAGVTRKENNKTKGII